jgi:hypothetical protein
MAIEPGMPSRADAMAFEERWAAWAARGAEHDRKIQKRAVAVMVVVAGGLALWLAVVLLFG